MPRSEFAIAVDEIQRAVRPLLKESGFRVRGRTFNRFGSDGLTHVVSFWMGPATSIFHGQFTVNLGVYVPEVAEYHVGGLAGSWVQDQYCCVRGGAETRTGEQLWWSAEHCKQVVRQVSEWLSKDGLPFIDRFATRDMILNKWRDRTENLGASSPPRIVKALILFVRDDLDACRALLSQQARETRNRHHRAYVRELAASLGLGQI